MQTLHNITQNIKATMTSYTIPKTAKAQIFEKAGQGLTLKEIPVVQPDELKDGEILIKVLACGVCHSDSAVGAGAFGELFPRIPGHEVIGDVAAVSKSEKKWKVGDRVGGGWHGGHDNACKQCQRGGFQFCENELVNGVSRDGGYAEWCTLRSESTVRIPKDLDVAKGAPLLCAGVTLFQSLRQMNVTPGGTVAIQGLGGLGHLGLQYSRKMGYNTVALSSSDKKKDFATKLGAHHYVDGSKEDQAQALQKLGGADLIVVTAPNPKIIGQLIGGIAPKGKLLILAPVGEVGVDTVSMIVKGISVHGWASGHQLDSEEAIAFADIHDVNCMVETFPLEKASEALKHMEEGNVRFRSVLVMN